MARETARQKSGQEKEQTGKEREKKKQVRKGDEKIEKEGKTRESKREAEKQLDTEAEVERGEGEYKLDGTLKVLFEEGISTKRYRALKREQIEKLKRFEAERRMKLNKTLAVQHVDPLFFRNLAQLANELHRACSAKMTKLDRYCAKYCDKIATKC